MNCVCVCVKDAAINPLSGAEQEVFLIIICLDFYMAATLLWVISYDVILCPSVLWTPALFGELLDCSIMSNKCSIWLGCG